MFYFTKILPLFALPLGVVILLMIAAIIWRTRWALVSAFTLLFVASLPLTGRLLLRLVEYGMERSPANAVVEVDAIVVLSEGRTVAPGAARISEWNDADRFFGGVELFKAGKAPLLVFTGGSAPWDDGSLLEGNILAGQAVEMGVPIESIRITSRVLNTKQEADAVANLARQQWGAEISGRKILLVTSAYHMTRAREVFVKAGLEVIPFPVDFFVSHNRKIDVTDFIPSALGLHWTSVALREVYGLAIVRLC
jgi:uncharacterized SAM-binding protein YcdF (DUF218 family)